MFWKSKKCGKCRQMQVYEKIIPYKTTITHDNCNYDIEFDQLTVLQCERCQTIIIPDEGQDKITEQIYEKANLLKPNQIKTNRELLNLTQKELADLFDIHEAVVARWELGHQVHSHHTDILLRGFFSYEPFRHYIFGRKAK